jgi:hypothetical protein
MNLDEVLDVTEPVMVQFMEQTITVHVYTAGTQRLTHEEVELLKPSTHDNEPTTAQTVEYIRRSLPIIVKGIDLNGEPLIFRDLEFPGNVKLFPNPLLVAVGNAAMDKWNVANPTSGEQSPAGEQPPEKPEQSQAATSTP